MRFSPLLLGVLALAAMTDTPPAPATGATGPDGSGHAPTLDALPPTRAQAMKETIRGLARAQEQAAEAVSAYEFSVRHVADSLRAYGCTLAHLLSPVGKAHAKRLRKNARRLREWRGMRS